MSEQSRASADPAVSFSHRPVARVLIRVVIGRASAQPFDEKALAMVVFRMAHGGDREHEAARRLLATPVTSPWMIWRKWEIVEIWAVHEADGKWEDNRVSFALGCIKADLARFRFEA